MESGLNDHFDYFISERMLEIFRQTIANSVKYQEIRSHVKRLGGNILEYLPDQYQDLFMSYEDLENACGALMQESYYKSGIEDGIRFAKAFGKV